MGGLCLGRYTFEGMEMGRPTQKSSTIILFVVWMSVVVIVGKTGIVEGRWVKIKRW